MNATIEGKPMGLLPRLKAAAGVLRSGKLPNPLAETKDPSEEAQVQEFTEWCLETREFWKPVFDRIREEQNYGAGRQWPDGYKCKGDDELEPFIGDVIQQMLNRKTASLYAKNPTPEAKTVEKLYYAVWDGTQESLSGAKAILANNLPAIEAASSAMAVGQEPADGPSPELANAMAILKDYESGLARKAMIQRIAKTATLLIEQQWRSQSPEFIISMKQMVTRILSSRCAFIKVMYRRDGDEQPVQSANLPVDMVAALKLRLEQMTEPDFDATGPVAAEAAQLMQALLAAQGPSSAESGDGADEGLVYDFLPVTSVLVDPRCRCLREFIGARRIAHEIVMDKEEAEKEFKVDLDDCGAVAYTDACAPLAKGASHDSTDPNNAATKVCIWHIEDKDTGMCCVVCDGVKNFIKAPYANEPRVTRFWSIVPVVFNVQEVEKNDPQNDVTIYPRSDVRLAMPMQRDINNAGEGLREHRVANRPWWVAVKNKFPDGDLSKLGAPRKAHDAIALEGLNPGEKITDYLQPGPNQTIDPKLYDPAPSNQAMMLATGMQPANLGAQNSNEKATGQSIAEGSRISADQSNIHDLDLALSIVTQMSFEILSQEMDEAQVKERVGVGALWPRLSWKQVKSEVYFQIEAGSSGRPNQALEVNNFKLIGPILQGLLEQSGKSMDPLIKEAVRRLNDKLDVDDFLKPAQVGPMGAGTPNIQQPTSNIQPGAPIPAGMPAPGVAVPGRPTSAPPLPPQSKQQVMASAGV